MTDRKRSGGLITALVIGVATGLVVGGAFAYAAIPDNTGVFTACYKTGGARPGTMRMIDPSASPSSYASRCAAGEVQVSWNSGMNERGTWDTASHYNRGDVVQRSGASFVAMVGNTDVDPTVGTGSTWTLLAAQGPQGPAGNDGAQGPQGPAGANGSTILSGSGTPASTLGNVGDYYVDTTNKLLYGPKTVVCLPTCSGLWSVDVAFGDANHVYSSVTQSTLDSGPEERVAHIAIPVAGTYFVNVSALVKNQVILSQAWPLVCNLYVNYDDSLSNSIDSENTVIPPVVSLGGGQFSQTGPSSFALQGPVLYTHPGYVDVGCQQQSGTGIGFSTRISATRDGGNG